MLAVSPTSSFSIVLPNEQATRRLAADVASILKPGDLVTLSGDLGAGKTAFARALIRHLAGDETLDVPSPTFTLVQTYALPRLSVLHADLFRVGKASELTAHGSFVPRLERLAAIRQFLTAEGLADAARTHVQGDASSRSYERLTRED